MKGKNWYRKISVLQKLFDQPPNHTGRMLFLLNYGYSVTKIFLSGKISHEKL